MSMSYSSLAVIGFGCDLPGGSNGVEAYWDTIIQGRSGIKSSRDQRWRYSGYLDTTALHQSARIVDSEGCWMTLLYVPVDGAPTQRLKNSIARKCSF